MEVILPYPPSANRMYRFPKKLEYPLLSKEGREYYKTVARKLPRFKGPITQSVAVSIGAVVPDKRKRDLDNIIKPILDALTKAGCWVDDSQVKDLRVTKIGVLKPGHVRVIIWELME